MENQGNGRVILAVALAFVVLFGWSYLFPSNKTKPKPPASDAVSATSEDPAQTLPPEEEFALSGDGFRAVLSSHGGRIKSWKILDPQYNNAQGEPYDLVSPVPAGVRAPWPGEISFSDPPVSIPRTMIFQKASEDGDPAGSLRLRWAGEGLQVDKLFTVQGGDVTLQVITRNLGDKDLRLKLSVAVDGYQDPNKMEGSGFFIFKAPPDLANPTCYANETNNHIIFAKEDKSESFSGEVSWFGVNRTYFLKAFYPLEALPEGEAALCAVSTSSNGAERALLTLPGMKVPKGGETKRSFGVFFGPKKLESLEAHGSQLENSIDYGWLGFLSRPMLVVLKWAHGAVGNWGLAVVLLTLLVRALMFYPSQRSFKSMQGMAALKPQLDELKAKYGDDQQGYAQAQMALMRSSGVSPLGGCLPLLLQMPFFFALYRMIYQAVELYQADMGLWIHDLSIADPYFILPIFLGGVMVLQQRLTPNTMDAAQARIMQWMLPIMMFLFMAFLPAALVIYTLTSTVFGFLQQYLIKRMNPTPATAGAAVGKSSNEAMSKALAKKREDRQNQNQPRPQGGKRDKR
jgi:YidC/Oxa1 family membrane protein insertase